MKKHTTRSLQKYKKHQGAKELQMLTCYDYQTAQLLNELPVDMLLVGDSLGNVVLGYETTIPVTLQEMSIFCSAVKRGAPDKFVIGDLPFGSYATLDKAIESTVELFKTSKVEAVKLEGAGKFQLQLIERLTEIGVPVVGHIGLMPQSVHQQGGYFTHGKDEYSATHLLEEALALERAGAFCLVLEYVEEKTAQSISEKLRIPTIGIGSGKNTDGQVMVLNDLLKVGKKAPPSHCKPILDLYEIKKEALSKYLNKE